MAMLFPVSVGFFIFENDRIRKSLLGALCILLAFNWLGSGSRAGLVGGAFALIVFFIVIHKIVLKKWKYFVIAFLILFSVGVSLNVISNGLVSIRVSSLFNDAIKFISPLSEAPSQKSYLSKLSIDGNRVQIVTPDETLSFEVKGIQIFFSDGDGNNIPVRTEPGRLVIEDKRYDKYNIQLGKFNEKSVIRVIKGPVRLDFSIYDRKVGLLDPGGNEVTLDSVPHWGFEGKETLGSARGYIWSRTIPLMKDTLIFGFGPDTFAAFFPNNDIVGKANAYGGNTLTVVDKPHNLYLQTALNTGIISLLSLLILFGMYIISGIRLYFASEFKDKESQYGVIILSAIIGYLIAGFFNDSVVSVAPVFWVLLSIGIVLELIIKKKALNE
jgi:hypothetical protein